MKRSAKLISMLLSVVLALSLFITGCSSKTEKQEQKPAESKPKVEEVKYPTKAIQVIVPAGTGGMTDVTARITAKYLEKELGQPVVIVNTNGAGGSIGSRKVQESAPDGYTVLYFHNGLIINKLMNIVDYSYSEFENGGVMVQDNSNGFFISSKSKFKDLKDVIEQAKKSPETITFATETGSFTNLEVIAFQEATGVKFNIVDVGADAQKVIALKGNQIDVMPGLYGSTKGYLESKDFKYLGILPSQRNPLIPDVPTFKEQGVDFSFDGYTFGYFFPKGTPKEITEKFSKALEKISKMDEFKKENEKLSASVNYMAPDKAVSYWKGISDYYNKFKDKLSSAAPVKK